LLSISHAIHATITDMELDQISGMFGARQMRNCLPCKKRKIKCE